MKSTIIGMECWDWKEQPNWASINKMINKWVSPRLPVRFTEVNMGDDNYYIVISFGKITITKAREYIKGYLS